MNMHTTPQSGPQAPVAAFLASNAPIALGASPRAVIEAEVERLISLLDAIDGDPDFEETGDLEPSLGHYTGIAASADFELDEADSGVGDRDGLWEQGHLAGRGLELLEHEAAEARAALRRVKAMVERVAGPATPAEVRP